MDRDPGAESMQAGLTPPLLEGLHVCRACRSSLVEPVYRDPVGATRWALTLACPECDWWTSGVWSDDEVERLEVVLADATVSIVTDCAALALDRFVDEIERFVRALEADVITVADF
jgi:hypothetical protein